MIVRSCGEGEVMKKLYTRDEVLKILESGFIYATKISINASERLLALKFLAKSLELIDNTKK